MKTLTYHAAAHTTTINERAENDILAHLQHEVGGYIEACGRLPLWTSTGLTCFVSASLVFQCRVKRTPNID